MSAPGIPSTGPDGKCTKRDRSGRSCIQSLANGWIGPTDLCAVCTGRFMAALDSCAKLEQETLDWHPAFVERAAS